LNWHCYCPKAYHLEGDLPNAIQYADRVLNIDPENFQSLIWRAQLALTQADPALSQELISRIPGSNQNENVIELRAKIALFNDNYEAALKEYEKIPVERKFETLLCDRVNVVRKVSGSEEAFMLLQELVQELPNSVQIQRLYAGYLRKRIELKRLFQQPKKLSVLAIYSHPVVIFVNMLSAIGHWDNYSILVDTYTRRFTT